MLFLCYPKCSTCRKAKAWLEANGLAYELRDIQLEKPSAAELEGWQQQSGLPLRRFFNTSGLQYRSLGLKDRLPQMGEAEQIALLASDEMLVKRPLLIGEDFVLLGFNEEEWTQRLLTEDRPK
ncbi:MAG: arsenate reductase family protein [Bacillota bacterium]|nr:arsenate reductase family protein [Bacillota bacterium]